ncbi:MAG: DnaA/Hda family protein [Pseudomonadota bacterium]
MQPYHAFFVALERRLGGPTFRSWLSDIEVESVEEKIVRLSTTSPTRKHRLDSQFKHTLQDEWRRNVGHTDKIVIHVRNRERLARSARKANDNAPGAAPLSADAQHHVANDHVANDHVANDYGAKDFLAKDFGAAKPAADGSGRRRGFLGSDDELRRAPLADFASPLEATSTLDTFAVDRTNRLARAAVDHLFDTEGAPCPIYLFGPSGVGKSHLLYAAGHAGAERYTAGRVAYFTHTALTTACSGALRSGAAHELLKEFLNYDLVLIDDVHMLRGKRTQQELTSLISAFASHGKRLVLAGCSAPRKLKEDGLEPRLADHLSGGLAVAMEPSDVDLRRAVIEKRIAAGPTRCTLAADAISFIAERFDDSTRSTLGALHHLFLKYTGEARVLSRAEVEEALHERLKADERPATFGDLLDATAHAFGLSPADVVARNQRRFVANARHAFVYVARETLGKSFPQIAHALKRDHTTIISSYRRAESLITRDRKFQDPVEKIIARVARTADDE